MQNEYDFSNAERGRAKGIEINQLVNNLLKCDIDLIEMAK